MPVLNYKKALFCQLFLVTSFVYLNGAFVFAESMPQGCDQAIEEHNRLLDIGVAKLAPHVDRVVRALENTTRAVSTETREAIGAYRSIYLDEPIVKASSTEIVDPWAQKSSGLSNQERMSQIELLRPALRSALLRTLKSKLDEEFPDKTKQPYVFGDVIVWQGHVLLKGCVFISDRSSGKLRLTACSSVDLADRDRMVGNMASTAINHPSASYAVSPLMDRFVVEGVDLQTSYLLLKDRCPEDLKGSVFGLIGEINGLYDLVLRPDLEFYDPSVLFKSEVLPQKTSE